MHAKVDTLAVPGATLHHEVRGSGPVLLLICGGIYDAGGYARLAEELADRHTVVTYDRRGNSRSPLDEPAGPVVVAEQPADALAVLAAVGVTAGEPADVFGNSSGAIIALALAAAHPEVVRTVVAHEPPVFELLPDAQHWRDVIRDTGAAYAAGGPYAAMGVFGPAIGATGDEAPTGDLDPETAAMMARIGANFDVFVGREVPGFAAWTPDLDALRALGDRVAVGVGAASEGQPPNRTGRALAERLSREPVTFPGDHGGFGAPGFGARLREVLG
jgi:pimeloyl-ACP methyl ester carboxylesterase